MSTLRETIISFKHAIEELEGVLDALQKIVGDDLPGMPSHFSIGDPVTGVGFDPNMPYSTVTGYNPETGVIGSDNEPWIVTHKRANLLTPRVRYLLYRERNPNYLVLEPFISTGDAKELSTLIGNMTVGSAARQLVQRAYEQFIFVSNDYETLFISRVPKNLREYWPFLQRQLNAFEYRELPPWQQALYYADGNIDTNKWVLRDAHEAWAKE